MKITEIQTLPVGRYLFVKVRTDDGIVGTGESGAWAYHEATEAIIKKFARYLVGQDPRRIEHHWQYLYRAFHFRGASIAGALSAIDIALWDIKGKALGVPVYELLGGKTRDRVRVYQDIHGATVDDVVADALAAKEKGYTALGHLSPFPDGTKADPYFKPHALKMSDAVEAVARYREAVGNEVDLCIECHRRLTAAEAITLGRAIEPFNPLFYEDPLRPDNFDEMGDVAGQINVPIATGERLHTIDEYEMLFARRACRFVRPSIGLCGGLTGAKKIAAMAEARGIGVCPHHVSSPFLTGVYVQLAASIPNFVIAEYQDSERASPKSDIVAQVVEYDGNGFLIVPDRPGIGIDLVEDAAERWPVEKREVDARLHVDGSVVDF
jgi:galactonate dehydratase